MKFNVLALLAVVLFHYLAQATFSDSNQPTAKVVPSTERIPSSSN